MNRQGRNEDKARQRNIYARKHLQSEMDAQRDMERVHLQTIRNEKIRLQKELDRMRNKGQYMVKRHGASNHTQRLLKLRLEHGEQSDVNNTESNDDESTARLGFPEINSKEKRGNIHANEGAEVMTREQRMIERRRKETEKKQDALVARVDQLTEGFNQKNGKTPLRRQRSVSPVRSNSNTKSDDAQTSKSDSFYTSSRRQSNRTKLRTMTQTSIIDADMTQAKNSVARRLLQTGSSEGANGEISSRKVSHVLPIDGVIKSDNSELPHFAEDLVFDQDKFAPDGHVRTVHLLPDTEDAFREAKKARYLRWKGPNARDRELSVGEIFGEERVQ